MSEAVLSRIRRFLAEHRVSFREVNHCPSRSSEESARARGEPLSVGAKALLLRTETSFRLFILPGNRKLDLGTIKRHFGIKSLRFATPAELAALTGLIPGEVPPFGEPILPFGLYADPIVGIEYGRVAFNAGSLTTSIIMSTSDWDAVARPVRLAIVAA
jgi:Ala-tRNA(Pro) deacylase